MKNMSKELLDRINNLATPVKIMHVCGSHEHTIMENGIRSLLPDEVEIVAGPGCPVCVVPSREIRMFRIGGKGSDNNNFWRYVKSSRFKWVTCRC